MRSENDGIDIVDRRAHATVLIELPDLPTGVALAGTAHRAEVGGNVCFNTIISIAIVTGG